MTEITAGETIYVLSSGEYSDYSVLCACPSKEDAEQLAARYNAGRTTDKARVEELGVFDRDTQRVEILQMVIEIWDNGEEKQRDPQVWVEWPFDVYDGIPAAVSWRWIRAPMYNDTGGRLDVRGTDHERVRKVFSERRAEIIGDETGQLRKVRERTGGAR